MKPPTTDDRSARFARWWVQRYTAGLDPQDGAWRRAEIESDIVEHRRCREHDGWTPVQISRERTRRLVRGMAADLGWRRDVLRAGSRIHPLVRASLLTVTSVATWILALLHASFAAYVLGRTSLADRPFLGGLTAYADEVGRPIAAPIAATIIAGLALALALAGLARPLSPLMANAVTAGIAMLSVMFFWLGWWPVAIVAIIGSIADLLVRSPEERPASPALSPRSR